ncbi:hypothetical protein ACFLV2_00560 [Chloroflexota bacterium]
METINIGYYFVAFIDVVGQRDKLKQLVSLPKNESEKRKMGEILSETSEYIKELRKQYGDYFSSAQQPTGLLDSRSPEQVAWLEERKKSIIWRKGFSDSYVITVPCWHESRFGVHIGSIYECLYGLCALQLWALVMEKPFRGAVEVDLAVEVDNEEVYGPVLVRAYEMESEHAGYPRIIVGQGLLNHLESVQKRCKDDRDSKHTLINIDNCRGLVTTDFDERYILDYIGEGVKSVQTDLPVSAMVSEAYDFTIQQQRQFLDEDNQKLYGYYSHLRDYIESRLSLWDIPVQPKE